ncbi:MAG: cytochrome C [Flavobacteriales bacterium CG_4_8_14_3_um_filter_35_10]|nr:MAG: cytochrome C [Flavobacteriales bacterium CG_4_8_14_3_um_filter_35_10]
MKHLFNFAILALLALSLSFCSRDNRTRNVRYMAATDMYNPVGYETYTPNPFFKNGLEAQLPVTGTIFRGEVPYEIPNTEEGYQLALKTLKSPLELSEVNLAKGKAMYTINCISCHGEKGDGQGVLMQRGKFLGVPNYKDRPITEGSIYHVIMFGRNLMGSHASQLTNTERWQVVQYVQQLREGLIKIDTIK